jgi:hypothetical protein
MNYRVTFTPTFYGKRITIDVSAPSPSDAKERVEWFASQIHSVSQAPQSDEQRSR